MRVPSVDHRGVPPPLSRLHVGPGERHALGLAVDPHRDPAGSERFGRLDGGSEPAVEVGGSGEAHNPDLGADWEHRGEHAEEAMGEEVPGRLESLVAGEREQSSQKQKQKQLN